MHTSSISEALLLAEVGPDAVQVLRPHYAALVGVADLAQNAGGQQLRSLLRHIGELTGKLAALEAQLFKVGEAFDAEFENLGVLAQQEEIRRLRIELQVLGSQQRQHTQELEAERLRAAGSNLSAETLGQEKAKLKAALRRVDEDQREQLEILSMQALEEKRRSQQMLEAKHHELIASRQAAGTQEAMLSEVRSLMPVAVVAAQFTKDPHSPAMKLARGPVLLSSTTSVRIPVLALRWGPGISLNSTPGWEAVREGLFSWLHRLQTGVAQPEQAELNVCEVDGRWSTAQVWRT
ncbi:cbpA [Symbiodinium pilosum]|uniref:CbpA protein n=1 Tax=Symbiodinium pilosum TaxID=2952 RepID=A0A812Y4B4_SYMPI|nr:cbpA [Symbiodinium pilosum]